MVKKNFHFSEAERNRVSEAVRSAESKTTGEIVPWIVQSCENYSWVSAITALMGVGIATLGLELVHWQSHWDASLSTAALWQGIGALIGLFLGFVPAVRRALIPSSWLAEEAHIRSLASFVSAGLHETRDHNGVLIFIALFERRVHILADKGVSRHVPASYWDDRVKEIVNGVHQGKPIDSLCHAIGQIGGVLAEHFPGTGKDANELSDELREH